MGASQDKYDAYSNSSEVFAFIGASQDKYDAHSNSSEVFAFCKKYQNVML